MRVERVGIPQTLPQLGPKESIPFSQNTGSLTTDVDRVCRMTQSPSIACVMAIGPFWTVMLP